MDKPLNKQGRPTRKIIGITAELRVAVKLLDNGFSVSWPFGDMEGYDLIADSGKRLARIQVRSTTKPQRCGTYKITFRKGGKHVSRYGPNDTDFFVAVLSYPDGIAYYVIPVKDSQVASTFFPPNRHPRFPEKRRTCALEKFRNRWDLLR